MPCLNSFNVLFPSVVVHWWQKDYTATMSVVRFCSFGENEATSATEAYSGKEILHRSWFRFAWWQGHWLRGITCDWKWKGLSFRFTITFSWYDLKQWMRYFVLRRNALCFDFARVFYKHSKVGETKPKEKGRPHLGKGKRRSYKILT